MKYLKYFESNINLYEEIEWEEYHNALIKYSYPNLIDPNIDNFETEFGEQVPYIAFTENQKEIINEIAVKLGYSYTTEKCDCYGVVSDPLNNSISIVSHQNSKHGSGKISIYKANISQLSDEWFYVEMDEYYKCDQFEGLLKCLEDNLK